MGLNFLTFIFASLTMQLAGSFATTIPATIYCRLLALCSLNVALQYTI